MSTLEKLVLGATALVSLSGCQKFPYMDIEVGENVILYPEYPSPDETLHCRVENVDYGTLFDFLWFVNKKFIASETDISGLLEPGYTQSGDYVECSAWVPASGIYTTFEYGYDGEYVE